VRRALGKGLSQLIVEEFDAPPQQASITAIARAASQPRTEFDQQSLVDLADSIRTHGVLQPLLVRERKPGSYELIAGERRLRAAAMAGLKTVPIVVREATDREALELAIIENVQREDISPIECARAYRRLIDEFTMTQEQVADRVGKSRVAVTNTLRLLRLPARVQAELQRGAISEGHGRALLGINGEPRQLAMLDRILRSNLTVREVESAAKPASRVRRATQAKLDPNDAALAEAISESLGAATAIRRIGKGGLVQIAFSDDEDLQRIAEQLGVEP